MKHQQRTLWFALTLVALCCCSVTSSAYDFSVNSIYYDINSEDSTTVSVTYRYYAGPEPTSPVIPRISPIKRNGSEHDYEGDVVIPPEVTYDGRTYRVTKIGFLAFYGANVTSVSIPNTVTDIEQEAFESSALESVLIPDNVTTIGDDAFALCDALSSLTIGKSVTSIGNHAFWYCRNLTSIQVAEGNPCYDSRENCNAIIGIKNDYLLLGCINTVIPKSVKVIGYGAFEGMGLISIDLPESLRKIQSSAFKNCSKLTSVIIPNSVTDIGSGSFEDCLAMIKLTLGKCVERIGMSAFAGCKSLTSLALPDSLSVIDDFAFAGCSGLTDVQVPDGVKTLGTGVFRVCTGLTTAKLPEQLINISDELFYACSNLASVSIPETATSIGEDAFYGCRLSSVVVPESVTRINDGAFAFCKSLTDVSLPESLCDMGRTVFRDTPWYSRQPNGVVYAGQVAIGYKGNMPDNGKIVLRHDTKGIADYAFYDRRDLRTIVLSGSLLHIGGSSFWKCDSLEVPDLPSSVISIGRMAFAKCKELTKVVCKAPTPPEMFSGCFDSCKVPLYIPLGTTALYSSTYPWSLFETMIEVDFDYVQGDVNGDKEITVSDINSVIAVVLGATPVPDGADVNNDGEINLADVNEIIDIILQTSVQ